MQMLVTALESTPPRQPVFDVVSIDLANGAVPKASAFALFRKLQVMVEVNVADLWMAAGEDAFKYAQRLSVAKKVASLARRKVGGVPSLILSTGCRAPHEVRTPAEVVHVGELLGLSHHAAVECVTTAPLEMLLRSLRRAGMEP